MSDEIIELQEEKEARYRLLVRPRLMELLKQQIVEQVVVNKKYRDPAYTAKRLADDLDTNVKYISAVVRVKFHTNFCNYVNRYRVADAMALLVNQRYLNLNVEDIGKLAGFAHRQTFHTAFLKQTGQSPNAYRKEQLELLKRFQM